MSIVINIRIKIIDSADQAIRKQLFLYLTILRTSETTIWKQT